MRTDHLKYFVALAENHSMNKTSLKFYTTHQNVSKIIRQLEEELNAPLFVRSPKGVTLTPQGELLLPFAQETLERFHRMQLDIDHMNRQHDLKGELHLWGTPIANATIMQTLLADFNHLYPNVQYQVNECGPFEILRYVSLHNGDLGLAAIMNHPAYQDIYQPYLNQIRLFPFQKDEYYCAMSCRSPLANNKKISLAKFCKQPIIMVQFSEGDQETQPFLRLIEKLYNTKPTFYTQSRHLYTRAIAAGNFLGISSRASNELRITSDDIVCVPFEEDLTFDISLVVNVQPQLEPIQQLFVNMVLGHTAQTNE